MTAKIQRIPLHRMTASQLDFHKLFKEKRSDRWQMMSRALDAEPDLATSVVYLDIWTALHWAVGNDEEEALVLAEKILKLGVSPDLNVDGCGRTPLMAAAFNSYKNQNYKNSIRLLLKYGADINARDAKGACVFHEILSNTIICEPDCFRLLLDNGADPNIADLALNTPLHQVYGSLYAAKTRLKLSRTVAEKEAGEYAALPPKSRQRKERERTKYQESILSGINNLEEIAALLVSCGADIKAKNGFGRTPPECAIHGFGRNENESWVIFNRFGASARDFYRPVQSIWIAVTDIIKDKATHIINNFKRQRLPADADLSTYLKLIPRKYTLPPASSKLLDELESMLNGNLPPQIVELYRDHSGFSEFIEEVPYSLMTPDEVMETLCDFINNDYDMLNPFNDGKQTCIFWQNQWLDYAGVFIEGPLKGKVFLTEDSSCPCPNFRDVTSFYRCQLLNADERNWDFDYPFRDAASEIKSDIELSHQLLQQWIDDGRCDATLALNALTLSSVNDGKLWADELAAIITNCSHDDTWNLEDAICAYAGGRKWLECVGSLIKEVESDRRTGEALKALKAIGSPDALDALESFRKTHGDDAVAQYLR